MTVRTLVMGSHLIRNDERGPVIPLEERARLPVPHDGLRPGIKDQPSTAKAGGNARQVDQNGAPVPLLYVSARELVASDRLNEVFLVIRVGEASKGLGNHLTGP